MSDDDKGKKAERIGLYHKLAERAWNRFESHRRVEWRICFGVWTALGAGVIAVLTSGSWAPGLVDILVAAVVGAVILAACCCWWLPRLGESLSRDNWNSYYWETHLFRELVDKPSGISKALPEVLQPPKYDGDTWPSAFDDDPNMVGGKAHGVPRELPKKWHTVQWLQFGITWLFCVLLVAVMLSKGLQGKHAEWEKDIMLVVTLATLALEAKCKRPRATFFVAT